MILRPGVFVVSGVTNCVPNFQVRQMKLPMIWVPNVFSGGSCTAPSGGYFFQVQPVGKILGFVPR